MDGNEQNRDVKEMILNWLEKASKNRNWVFAFLILSVLVGGLLSLMSAALGAYLMWKGGHFTKNIRMIISGVLVLVVLYNMSSSGTGGDSFDSGSCRATFTSGNCTYFRDSSCNVIGSSCN